MHPINFMALGPGLISLRYLAPATFEQWVSTLESALAQAAGSERVNVLMDRRGIPTPPTAQTVAATVEYFERPGTRIRRFAAVVDGQAAYGVGRMLEVLTEHTGVEFRVFQVYEEALGWLGGPTPAS